jgi:hypothetical protein
MRNFIYLRKSCDWAKTKCIEDYKNQNKDSRILMKNWMPDLIRAIEIWNNTFNLSFYQIRDSIKKISLDSIRSLNVEIFDKDRVGELLNKNDFLLYISDDDDWVQKEIFSIIEQRFIKSVGLYIWPTYRLSCKSKIHSLDSDVDGIRWTYTNNCIITKKVFDELYYKNQNFEFLECHRLMDENVRYFEKYLIPNFCMSVYNQTPASATKLWSTVQICDSDKKIKKCLIETVERYKYSINKNILPQETKWCEKYLIEYINLLNSLNCKKIKI